MENILRLSDGIRDGLNKAHCSYAIAKADQNERFINRLNKKAFSMMHMARFCGSWGGGEERIPLVPCPSHRGGKLYLSGGRVWGVGYPGQWGIPTSPWKEHGTRDNLPPEKTWDQGPGRDLPPEIPYPLPVDRRAPVKTSPFRNIVGGQ